MPNSKPDPKETITTLDTLVRLKLLTELEFRRMHHLGDSISGFRRHCSRVNTFLRDGTNHELSKKLEKMLDSYKTKQQRT